MPFFQGFGLPITGWWPEIFLKPLSSRSYLVLEPPDVAVTTVATITIG